jgi:hypothetical protein
LPLIFFVNEFLVFCEFFGLINGIFSVYWQFLSYRNNIKKSIRKKRYKMIKEKEAKKSCIPSFVFFGSFYLNTFSCLFKFKLRLQLIFSTKNLNKQLTKKHVVFELFVFKRKISNKQVRRFPWNPFIWTTKVFFQFGPTN